MSSPGTLAVITGTSRGIGQAIAAAADESGATVAACNRTATGRADELIADLSSPEEWGGFAAWIAELVDRHHPEQLTFVHNAATLAPIGFAGEVDSGSYRTNVLLNSAAPQVLGDAVVALAVARGVPSVVAQLSSGAGKTVYPGWSSYCAGKAAVDMWVRAVGAEQAQRGDHVRAVAIAPGVVDTSMQEQIRDTAAGEFPQVDRFRGLHADGQLLDPAMVGAKIWEIATSGWWENGAVLDVRDLI